MSVPSYASGIIPERFVEVDAARLLLIVVRFGAAIDDDTRSLHCFPRYAIVQHLSPEYYLQKLDFLLRYPGYIAFELAELHAMGRVEASNRSEIMATVREMLSQKEPDRLTMPYRRFWRGAYERLDDVEAWWYARELIYTGIEPRGQARPQKHYFATEKAVATARELIAGIDHAKWYAERIELLYRYFGSLKPGEVKALQYSHQEYRQAQLDETIPDLDPSDIADTFQRVFGEPLAVSLE